MIADLIRTDLQSFWKVEHSNMFLDKTQFQKQYFTYLMFDSFQVEVDSIDISDRDASDFVQVIQKLKYYFNVLCILPKFIY